MYLRYRDYLQQIQADQLTQIIGSDSSIRLKAELQAQEEVDGYISKRFDTTKEFIDMSTFSMSTEFKARDRVELDATAYSALATYALKALVLQSGNIYLCTTAITVAEAFTIGKWKLLGAQYDIYYVPLPYDEFSLMGEYDKDDFVFWKNYIYKALTPTGVTSHEEALQYEQTYKIPFNNVFPDARLGSMQWQKASAAYFVTNLYTTATDADYTAWSGVTVYVTANRVSYGGVIWEAVAGSANVTPGTNADKWKKIGWTLGDPRSQQMVMNVVDIGLYHIHSRINPRNIPPLRCERYDAAKKWIEAVSDGDITCSLIDIQPAQGRRLRFGSEVKNINSY